MKSETVYLSGEKNVEKCCEHPESSSSSSLWKEFLNKSTCTALMKINESTNGRDESNKWIKSIWIVTLLIGILLTGVSTYGSASSFFNMAATSEMLIEKVTNGRLDYPKFHICSSNMFNLSVLQAWGFNDAQIVSYLRLATSAFSVSPAILKNETMQHELATRLDDLMRINNLSMETIYERALLKCEEVIVGCVMMMEYLDSSSCCARYFGSSSFATSAGACVTTHSSATDHFQWSSTLAFGFTVIVRNAPQKIPLDNAVVNPLIANQRGVIYSASDDLTNPSVSLFRNRNYVRTGQWISLAIDKTITNDERVGCTLLGTRKCVDRDNEHEYRHLISDNGRYSQLNCLYTFRQKNILDILGCNLMNYPKGSTNVMWCKPKDAISLIKQVSFKFANHQVFKTNFLSDSPECISECVREEFKITAGFSDFELALNFNFDNWSILPEESKDLVVLNFFYPTTTFTRLVNHYPTINEWLGVLGGNLGLFLGASMISIIELIVFFCCCMCRKPANYQHIFPRQYLPGR